MRSRVSPALQQLWNQGAAQQWNRAYQQTYERATMNGVPAGQRNMVAAYHADYVTGRSQYPAPSIPYVTTGPGRVR